MDSKEFQVFSGLMKRRGFFWQSFDIYGGSAGFFDYGPQGARLKANIENLWRRYYVAGEGFAEIDTPVIKIQEVFEASGHLAKFTDVLTRCTSEKCGESFRADHLVMDLHPNPDSLNADEITAIIKENGVPCPRCGAALGECYDFNLMFGTKVGSDGEGFLQPETAQGIFINFNPLYRHFREKLPFGVVQLGKGFRNEISPRQGIIRLRELNMAEAEVFFNPENRSHAEKFPLDFSEAAPVITFLDAKEKEFLLTAAGACEKGVVVNPILAYFIDLTYRFLLAAGCDPAKLRFRQHQANEMAHYARDCWDAESFLTFPASPESRDVRGAWVEITGIADRSCFDLEMHMKRSGRDMTAMEKFKEPVRTRGKVIVPDLKAMGPVYRKKAKSIAAAMEALNDMDGKSAHGPGLSDELVAKIRSEGKLKVIVDEGREREGGVSGEDVEDGESGTILEIPNTCFAIEEKEIILTGKRYLPHVVEPSYGIDRILYTVLQHSFGYDAGEKYTVSAFPANIAPVQAAVLPLMGKPELEGPSRELEKKLRRAGFMVHYDSSGSVGRRYARMDEIGTPFCLTVDYGDVENGTVTVRERDSKKQKKISASDMPDILEGLLKGSIEFDGDWGSPVE